MSIINIISVLKMGFIIFCFSDAWFGLNDRLLEGYYQYADESSYDLDSPLYQPTITTLDYDCFVIVDDSTWTTDDCYSVRPYICQYSMQNGKVYLYV